MSRGNRLGNQNRSCGRIVDRGVAGRKPQPDGVAATRCRQRQDGKAGDEVPPFDEVVDEKRRTTAYVN